MPPAVPAPLTIIESFANSIDVETAEDDLDSVSRFRQWLAGHGRDITVNAAELALARALRDALRDAMRAHDEGVTRYPARLGPLLAQIPLSARASDDGVGLGPAEDGVRGFLGEVLAAVVLAAHDGTWRRLKICREETCAMAFYDRSKNGSRCWCSMSVCGNRNKTRAYRRRRHTDDVTT